MKLILDSTPVPLKTDTDGIVRVGGTRVTLDTLVQAFKSGATPEQIAHDYPVLELADVYAVITFYLRCSEQVEQHLAGQRRDGEKTRFDMESRFDPQGIRDRLLARRVRRDKPDAATAGG